MMVSMALFIIIVGLSTGLFTRTLKTQRTISQISGSLDDATLAIEQMAREIRVGYGFPKGDGSPSSLVFTTGNGTLVGYRLDGGQIARGQGAPLDYEAITNVEAGTISGLNFYIQNDPAYNAPPRVTVTIELNPDKGLGLNLQTTISSRILDDSRPPETP